MSTPYAQAAVGIRDTDQQLVRQSGEWRNATMTENRVSQYALMDTIDRLLDRRLTFMAARDRASRFG